MRVAILYNPRPGSDSGALDDAFEEYDEPETIAAIAKALAAMGQSVQGPAKIPLQSSIEINPQ